MANSLIRIWSPSTNFKQSRVSHCSVSLESGKVGVCQQTSMLFCSSLHRCRQSISIFAAMGARTACIEPCLRIVASCNGLRETTILQPSTLDSFDECLLSIYNVAALLADELPKRPLNRLNLRIACRTASWPSLLENALTIGYSKPDFVAAELVPLRRADVLQAATLSDIVDPNAFLERIDHLGISALASKPITLKMLLDTFRRHGDLPGNVLELYETGCTILCEEQNESRRAAHRVGSLNPRERVAVAGRIAAVTQFGNRFAIWTGTEAQGVPPEDVPVAKLIGGNETARNFRDLPFSLADGNSMPSSNCRMQYGRRFMERGWVATSSTAMRSQTNTG